MAHVLDSEPVPTPDQVRGRLSPEHARMTGPLYRELAQRLRDAGCRFVREGKGSHEIWYSPITRRHFPVPSNIVNRITANAILKQAGLPKAF